MIFYSVYCVRAFERWNVYTLTRLHVRTLTRWNVDEKAIALSF